MVENNLNIDVNYKSYFCYQQIKCFTVFTSRIPDLNKVELVLTTIKVYIQNLSR